MTTYADLINAKTYATIRDELLARLAAAGFPVAAWASVGNVLRALTQVDATTLAELYAIVRDIARAGTLDGAEGAWLDLHVQSRFSLTRIASTFAEHTVTLTVTSGAGPYTITPGQLVGAANSGGARFRSTNTTNVNITSASPVTFTLRAEAAGTGGNATPNVLITPALAGVSMAWTSLDVVARNTELDAELRTRARARWSVLGSGFTRDAVRYWATGAPLVSGGEAGSAGCTRASFAAPAGDGSYVVYVAGADGPLGPSQVAAVQAELDLHCPITDTPDVQAATQATITVAGTVRFKSPATSEEQAAVLVAINAYVSGLEMPDDGDTTTVDLAGIHAAIYGAAPGRIADVDLSSPTGDTAVTLGSVAVANTSGVTFTA